MLQAIELARLRRRAGHAAPTPAPARAAPAARRAAPASSPSTSRPARAASARRRDGFAYDNERPWHADGRPRLPHRPRADHQRHVPDASSRAAATGAASGGPTRPGIGRRSTTSPTPAGWARGPGRRVAPAPHRRRGAARPGRAGGPRLLVRGRRLRTGPRGPPADGGGVGEGGDLGPGDGRGPPVPLGRRRPGRATAARTSTTAASARARPGPTRTAPRPAARSACSATCGSGRRRRSAATRASARTRTASTPRSSSATGYRVLRGGSWATRAHVRHADVPQLGPPPAAADLRGGAAGVGRLTPPKPSCGSRSTRRPAHAPLPRTCSTA